MSRGRLTITKNINLFQLEELRVFCMFTKVILANSKAIYKELMRGKVKIKLIYTDITFKKEN